MAGGPAPAGWHPDPFLRHQLRYSDGRRWTEHVADDGVAGLDPLAPDLTAGAAPGPPTAPLAVPAGLGVGAAAERPWPSQPPVWVPEAAQAPAPPPSAGGSRRGRAVAAVVLWTAVLVAAVLVAVVVALAVRDGRADGAGRFEGTIIGAADVDRFDVHLERGDLLRVSALPDEGFDVMLAYAADRATAVADYESLAPEQHRDVEAYLEGLRLDDTRFADMAGPAELFVLYSVDRYAEGGPERDLFLAGADGTYVVLVRGFDQSRGGYRVEIERAKADDLLADRSRYDEVVDGDGPSFEDYTALFGEE